MTELNDNNDFSWVHKPLAWLVTLHCAWVIKWFDVVFESYRIEISDSYVGSSFLAILKRTLEVFTYSFIELRQRPSQLSDTFFLQTTLNSQCHCIPLVLTVTNCFLSCLSSVSSNNSEKLCVLHIKTYHGLYYPNVCTTTVHKSSTAAKDKLDYFYLLV